MGDFVTLMVHPNDAPDDPSGASPQTAPARMSWARLLKRLFDIDIDHCHHCSGTLKIIAAIEDPAEITKILAHLGLPTRALPRATHCLLISSQRPEFILTPQFNLVQFLSRQSPVIVFAIAYVCPAPNRAIDCGSKEDVKPL